jgi:hypothetical protein
MAKGTVEKRPLTDDEVADAERLKSLWLRFRESDKARTQAWLAEKTALGNQSLVGQYLNAHIQLNPQGGLGVCTRIGCSSVQDQPENGIPRLLR